MALNSQSHHSFYMDPIVPCFWCVQVIEIHLLFSIIKELVDILPKTSRNPHLSTKKGEKIDLSRKGLTSFFLLFSPSFYTWPTQKDAIEKLAQQIFFTCALVQDQCLYTCWFGWRLLTHYTQNLVWWHNTKIFSEHYCVKLLSDNTYLLTANEIYWAIQGWQGWRIEW